MADTRKVNISFQIGQSSELDQVWYTIYYGNGIYLSLLDGICTRSGYPHNGGYHTMHLSGITMDDLLAWLEVLCDSFTTRCPKITHLYQDVVEFFRDNKTVKSMNYRIEHTGRIVIE